MSIRKEQVGGRTMCLPDPERLWYAPTPRIRTSAARERAKLLVTKVHQIRQQPTAVQQSTEIASEHELFVALHVCAYQAAPRSKKQVPKSRQRRWLRRWQILREYLVEQNIGLARWMVGRFTNTSLDAEDLASEAFIALTRSVDRFNPWVGYKFSTYASNAISRAISRKGDQERRYRTRFPATHNETVERPTEPMDLNAELQAERVQHVMRQNLADLTLLEAKVIADRFYRRPERPMTYRAIGATVGLSKERVRQIQNVALEKIRGVMADDPTFEGLSPPDTPVPVAG